MIARCTVDMFQMAGRRSLRRISKLRKLRQRRPRRGPRTVLCNRGEWLWSPENIKGANKDAKVDVGRSTTVHNLLFWAYILYMSYVTKTFLLVSSSVIGKQLLCVVHSRAKKNEQKHTTLSINYGLVKNEFIFYKRYLRLSISVLYDNGSKKF